MHLECGGSTPPSIDLDKDFDRWERGRFNNRFG